MKFVSNGLFEDACGGYVVGVILMYVEKAILKTVRKTGIDTTAATREIS